MSNNPETEKLPPENDDQIVEVSLKHVVIGFSTLLGGILAASASFLLLKDYLRARRQRAFLHAFKDVLSTIQNLKEKS